MGEEGVFSSSPSLQANSANFIMSDVNLQYGHYKVQRERLRSRREWEGVLLRTVMSTSASRFIATICKWLNQQGTRYYRGCRMKVEKRSGDHSLRLPASIVGRMYPWVTQKMYYKKKELPVFKSLLFHFFFFFYYYRSIYIGRLP